MPKPSYNITFYRDGGEKAGELDFNGPEMKFTGNAEESAKVFFNWIAQSFSRRLKDERVAAQSETETPVNLASLSDNELTSLADKVDSEIAKRATAI
jgi:hypothetical protein